MASTIPLSRVVEMTRRFINRAPLVFTGTNDPAFSIGDWVRGFILSPPLAWRWNRGTKQIALVPGQQDYVLNIPNFGWLEQAAITDQITTSSTPSPMPTYQLIVRLDLDVETVQNQPTHIAARLDDGNGNITFRLMPSPDRPYVLNITWQSAAPIFQTISDFWTPIPDYFYYLIQTGFLAKSYEYTGDEKFAATMQMFVRQVAAANGGLSDSQIDLTLLDQLDSQRTLQSDLESSAIGRRGRTLS